MTADLFDASVDDGLLVSCFVVTTVTFHFEVPAELQKRLEDLVVCLGQLGEVCELIVYECRVEGHHTLEPCSIFTSIEIHERVVEEIEKRD